MNVEKLSPNVEITFISADGKKVRASMYSKLKPLEIPPFLLNAGFAVIGPRKDDKVKSYKVIFKKNIEKEKMREIAQEVKRLACFIDVKETRYQLIVKNQMSAELDSKVVVFNSNLSLEELFGALKKMLDARIEEALKDEIIFDTSKLKKSTHYVTLTRAGTLERRKACSKTFKIFCPNYSSKEIIELLKVKK